MQASVGIAPCKAGTTVKNMLGPLLGDLVNRGRVTQTCLTYLENVLTTVVRDARAAANLAVEIAELFWPLVAESGLDHTECTNFCLALEKHVATELYSTSEVGVNPHHYSVTMIRQRSTMTVYSVVCRHTVLCMG